MVTEQLTANQQVYDACMEGYPRTYETRLAALVDVAAAGGALLDEWRAGEAASSAPTMVAFASAAQEWSVGELAAATFGGPLRAVVLNSTARAGWLEIINALAGEPLFRGSERTLYVRGEQVIDNPSRADVAKARLIVRRAAALWSEYATLRAVTSDVLTSFAPSVSSITARLNFVIREIPRVRGLRDAELSSWRNYCRIQAQQGGGGMEERDPDAGTCPDGFRFETYTDPFDNQQRTRCVEIAVDAPVAPPPVIPTTPTGPTGPTAPVAPPAPTATQGNFSIDPAAVSVEAGSTATAQVSLSVAPTAEVTIFFRGATSPVGLSYGSLVVFPSGSTAPQTLEVRAAADAISRTANVRFYADADSGNYAGQTFELQIAITRPAAPEPSTPPQPLAPCPDGQERLPGSDGCVAECAEGERRTTAGGCEAIPVADPTCGLVNARSTLPADHSVQPATGPNEYALTLLPGNIMREVIRQVRNAEGDCETDWPSPPEISGYTWARDFAGVVTYTEEADTAPEDCPDPGTCGAGFAWSTATCSCQPIAVAPTEQRVIGLGQRSGYILFPENGSFRDIEFGAIAPPAAGTAYDPVDGAFEAISPPPDPLGPPPLGIGEFAGPDWTIPADQFQVWHSRKAAPQDTPEPTLIDVAADAAMAGSRDLNDIAGGNPFTRIGDFDSVIFWKGIILERAGGGTDNYDANGLPKENLASPPGALTYLKSTLTQLGDSSGVGLNIVVTPIFNPLNRKRLVLRFTRIDKTLQVPDEGGSPFGLAMPVNSLRVRLRYRRERERNLIYYSRSAGTEAELPAEVLADADRLAAYRAYRELAVTYRSTTIRLSPEFEFEEEDGLRAAGGILRTHEGAPVHPYRRVKMALSSNNEPEAESIVPGQWVRYADRALRDGDGTGAVASVQHVTMRQAVGYDAQIDAEAVIVPPDARADMPGIFEADRSEADGPDRVG